MISDVINDTGRSQFCVPTALAILSGKPLSVVIKTIKETINIPQNRGVRGLSRYETTMIVPRVGLVIANKKTYHGLRAGNGALAEMERRDHGYIPLLKPTMTQWFNQEERGSLPWLVFFSHHVVVVADRFYADTHTNGRVVDFTKGAELGVKKRARIEEAWMIRRTE